MEFQSKIWAGLGLGLAMICLAACGGEAAEKGGGLHGVEVDPAEQAGEAGHGGPETLPLPMRLAFMSGHVEAGLALYRAGELEMAAPHLLHPVSETHAGERAGLDALGFKGDLFEALSAGLENGTPATELESQLSAAEANLQEVAGKAGGDPVEIITFLMEIIIDEYSVGVPADTVEVAGEYQDAYGFAVVALDRAHAIEGQSGERVRAELQSLITLWPEAPIPPTDPTPADVVIRQVSAVLLELP